MSFQRFGLCGVHRRDCPVCGARQAPHSGPDGSPIEMTAHEYDCFKREPHNVPLRALSAFYRERLREIAT